MSKSIANKKRTLSPKQIAFLELYYNPYSETYGNGYKSALQAGYSNYHAKNATKRLTKDMLDYVGNNTLGLDHINRTLTEIASLSRQGSDSDRIRALELLAKLQGLLVERKQVAQVIKVELGQVNAPIVQVDHQE